MAKSKENDDITSAEIKRRTEFAKMEQLELNVQKERLALADKERNLCRIDLALEEFDKFLADFVILLKNLPDTVQKIIKNITPAQYKEIQDLVDSQIQRMAQKRIYLALKNTRDEREAASEKVYKARRKANSQKKTK